MLGENLLLTIAIDKYSSPSYPSLDNPIRDAKRLTGILVDKYGFRALPPIFDANATRENIVEGIYSISLNIKPEDNLVIYYAGHGGQYGTTFNGYWVPTNWSKISDGIWNSHIYDLIEGINAKHILLISDSCYSGTFITRTRSDQKVFTHEELDRRKSRWVFASAGEKKISDGIPGKGSHFSRNLCEFLQNNLLPSLSAGEIFEAVSIATKACTFDQEPRADLIPRPGNEGGQMIFKLSPDRSGDKTPSVKPIFPVPAIIYKFHLERSITYYEDQKSEMSYFFGSERGNTHLSDAIATQKRIALLGSAGSGKSVELQELAKRLSHTSALYVPIYKRFNVYTGQEISDYLPYGWEKVDQNSAVILLDGLDEIQTDFYFTAIRKIIDFSNRFASLRMVVSCRTNFYELPSKTFSGTLEGFSVYTLNDVSLSEISKYANETLKIDGKQFIKDVYESSCIDLITKPYFLNVLTDHYLRNGNIPIERAIIFEEALLSYYNNDKEHYKTTLKLPNRSTIFSYLEKIAFVMEVMGRNYISDEELSKVFPNPADYENCFYLPAFKKQDDKERWMFEHNNIQEFLASKVLSQKSFDKLIEIISIPASNGRKVKPTWVNTVSFLISIGNTELVDKVIAWIITNDVESIIRFEPDRVTRKMRIKVFKEIFDFYDQKQIWLHSNKFSDSDLARFGSFKEVIEFLIEKIRNAKTTRITKINAVRVLDKISLNKFSDYYNSIKRALLDLLDTPQLNDYDIYSVLGALSDLNVTDQETVELIIFKYRNRKNQYVRAGIYKILNGSAYLNDYLEVLLEGLDLSRIKNPVEDRDSINLMDESFHLTKAFEKIDSPESLKILLSYFTEQNIRSLYISDYKEIIEAIVSNSINGFTKDFEIYDSIKDFFLISENMYNKEIRKLVLPFFIKTATNWNIFEYVFRKTDVSVYNKSELLEGLISKEIISKFLELYRTGIFSNDEAKLLHQILYWNDRDHTEFKLYMAEIEFEAKNTFSYTIAAPVFEDWNEINKKKTQKSFNLLFDKEHLLKEIEEIFLAIGHEEIDQQELFNVKIQHTSLEDVFIRSAVNILQEFTYGGNRVKLESVRNFIYVADKFNQYQIETIYEYLHGSNGSLIEVNDMQLNLIRDWCMLRGDDNKILWFYINRFKIQLIETKVLELTTYYDFEKETKIDESGTIEQLEPFISFEKLKDRVVDNLRGEIVNSFSWLSNASYALRKNLRQTYSSILLYLERAIDTEYKFNDILEFWFSKTQDANRMAVFIEKVASENLKWKGINILKNFNKESEFLKSYLKKIMQNEIESMDYRFMAANYLMELNELSGLEFVANHIFENPNPNFDFRQNMSHMSKIKDLNAIPILMNLLFIGKQKSFQTDRFNSLESEVIDTLYNIGIESDVYFNFVKSAIEKFISENNEKLDNLNFLHFSIMKIEDQLSMKKSQTFSINAALIEWDRSF